MLIKEHDLYQTNQKNRWDEIQNSSHLKTAAAAGCFGNGYTPNQKTPDFDLNAVLQIEQDDITGVPIKAFHTDRESIKNPGHYLTYLYTGDSPNYVFVGKKAYKCKQLEKRTKPSHLSGVSLELYNALTSPIEENGLGYKGHDDVKGNDIFKYELVNIKDDPDLKEGGRFYNKVKNVQSFFTTMNNQELSFWLWKPTKKTAPVYDVEKSQQNAEKYFLSQGYKICSTSDLEDGTLAKVDLYAIYGSAYDQGTFMCKPWTEISDKKADCITAIDSYYEEAVKYTNTYGTMVTPIRDLGMMKNQVKKCMSRWYDNKGFNSLGRRKKLDFIRSLKITSPFVLRESTDKLSSIIRESLRIVKIVKNSL